MEDMHFSVLMSVYIKEKSQFLKESLNSVSIRHYLLMRLY